MTYRHAVTNKGVVHAEYDGYTVCRNIILSECQETDKPITCKACWRRIALYEMWRDQEHDWQTQRTT